MTTTRTTRHIRAPRAAVYRALLDARAVQTWMVPDGMRSEVHRFEAWEGGTFRISLTYDAPDAAGKSSAHTDTQQGRFVRLVPDAEVVQAVRFETADPALGGEMTIRYTLVEAGGGTDVTAVHEGVPASVPEADNALGWEMALGKLAKWVEEEGA